ncbi:MAG: hypothetical protein KJI70_01045 [Patescibacteria group bacterium]|nr:hypothetical protein [Patescibacteria group bacterium]
MSKKIFDIIPPGKFKKDKESLSVKQKIREKIIGLEKKDKEPEILITKKKVKKKKFKIGQIFALVFLISLVFLAFQISKAEITIWPETEQMSFESKVVLDIQADEVDLTYKSIPAQVFESQKVLYEEFYSTGQILQKAEGAIRLYNEYSAKSETWLAGTRFVSSDGKLFKSKDKIIVPGAELKDGKLIARYVDVPVIAAEASEEYNIEPTHFSIYVFRGTPRYTKFYGESLQTMTGGGESLQVTEKDLETAEESLVEKAKSACEKDLKSKIPENQIFIEDILETEILEKFSLTKSGYAVEKFDFKVKSKCKTILFEKQDIKNYVKQTILSKASDHDLLHEESLTIDYTVETIDFDLGKVSVSLDIFGEVYQDLNLNALKKELIGKSLDGTKLFLESQPEISKVEVGFWPFWVKNVPKENEKINIEYSFTNSAI